MIHPACTLTLCQATTSSSWWRRLILGPTDGRPLAMTDLGATPLVLREAGSGTREVLERALGAFGLEPSPLVELASTTAIKASIAAGTGPGVLSRLAVEPEVADGRLVVVVTAGIPLERQIRAIWPSERPLMPAASRLLRHITDGGAGS